MCKMLPNAAPTDHHALTIRAGVITDPWEKRTVTLRVVPPEQVLRLPGMGRGMEGVAGAKVRTLDDFQNGLRENGSLQGTPARTTKWWNRGMPCAARF